jgi:hypothetical protein
MTELAQRRIKPRRAPKTVAGLQQEIAQKRGDLAEDLDLLRDAVSVQLDPIVQLRAHPRLALGVSVAAVGIACVLAFAFLRAMRADASR